MRFSPAFLASLEILATTARCASPANDVDLMIGVRGNGSCIPGPCVPNGSIHPSPDTLVAGNGGYAPHDTGKGIVGFSQLHAQGSGGVKSYGNFLVSPQIGLAIEEKDHASPIDHELARADMYIARLSRYAITCEVTPAAHSALYRFTFPESSEATITLDVTRKLDKAIAVDAASIHLDPATATVTGEGDFRGNWNPAPYKLFFAAQISRAPDVSGIWHGDQIAKGTTDATVQKDRLGAFIQWNTTQNEAIYLKIAVSFVSIDQAKHYLASEIPAWDFDALRLEAHTQWNDALSSITIDGASSEDHRIFYTALYHCFVQPRNRTHDNPRWQSDEPFYDDYYTLWDSWRTLFPLLAIVRPQLVADNVNAFLDRHDHDGQVATALTQGQEMKTGQGGDEADNIIADACIKQIPGIDIHKAYAMLQDDAEHARTPDYREHGWVASDIKHDYDWRLKSASSTLAFAYADFCTAQVARQLGNQGDATRYTARAANWKNVWDPTATDADFHGFPRARLANGAFAPTPSTKGYNTDFYEGTCWVYSYFVPGDIPGMIAAMGGRDAFIARLQYALDHNLIDFTNEPSFDTLWWFSAAGRPDLTAKWADKLKSLYTSDGYPGDEDNGAMSSLYLFVVSGFYPIAGQDLYYLHGPRLPKITFRLAAGKTFTILGKDAGPDHPYIQSATLNGQPLLQPSLTHEQITAGGTLECVMGATPSHWGNPTH